MTRLFTSIVTFEYSFILGSRGKVKPFTLEIVLLSFALLDGDFLGDYVARKYTQLRVRASYEPNVWTLDPDAIFQVRKSSLKSFQRFNT